LTRKKDYVTEQADDGEDKELGETKQRTQKACRPVEGVVGVRRQ